MRCDLNYRWLVLGLVVEEVGVGREDDMGVMGLFIWLICEILKLWKRGVIELMVEWVFLLENWKLIFGGLLF